MESIIKTLYTADKSLVLCRSIVLMVKLFHPIINIIIIIRIVLISIYLVCKTILK